MRIFERRCAYSNTPGDHSGQPANKSLHSNDIHFRARISNIVRVFQTLVEVTMLTIFGGTKILIRTLYSMDIHFRIFQKHNSPLKAAPAQVFFMPRTPVFVRIFQTLEVTILGSFSTSLFVPRTSVFVRVFQTLEVIF